MYLYGKRCDEPLGSCCPVPDIGLDVDIRRSVRIVQCRSCGSVWEVSEADLASSTVPWRRIKERDPSRSMRSEIATDLEEAVATINELKEEFGLHKHASSVPPVRSAPKEAWMGMDRPTGFKGGDSIAVSIDGAPTKESMTEALKSMQSAIDNALIRVPQPVTVRLPKKKRKPDPKPPSRHQARLEKHAARRPLPGDKRAKPEGKGRRWFWPLVAAFLMLVSGIAGAITIADKWPLF